MPTSTSGSLLPLAFLAFGVLFLVLGLRHLVGDRRRRASWLTFPGRVVASRLDDGQYRSQVAYRRDGREVTFWNRYTATSITDPVGREVEVLVNPENPADAVVSRGLAGGSTTGVAMIGFGAVAAVVGFQLLG